MTLPLEKITVLEKGDCQHIEKLEIKTKKQTKLIKGDLKIRNYFDSLRSSTFKLQIKYKKKGKKKIPGKIIIWGAGFGHGVGMCQEGAQNMAEEGFGYLEILKHYYNNVEIRKIY